MYTHTNESGQLRRQWGLQTTSYYSLFLVTFKIWCWRIKLALKAYYGEQKCLKGRAGFELNLNFLSNDQFSDFHDGT